MANKKVIGVVMPLAYVGALKSEMAEKKLETISQMMRYILKERYGEL